MKRIDRHRPGDRKLKKRVRLRYPNYSGALAALGSELVFIALMDGTITTSDETTLEELSKFNVPLGLPAPAEISEETISGDRGGAEPAGAVQAQLSRRNSKSRETGVLYIFGL